MKRKNDFEITVNQAPLGTFLSLKINRKKKFSKWSVTDNFNGSTPIVSINENIYGFYVKGNKVQLDVFDATNKKTSIMNVFIE